MTGRIIACEGDGTIASKPSAARLRDSLADPVDPANRFVDNSESDFSRCHMRIAPAAVEALLLARLGDAVRMVISGDNPARFR